MADERRSRLRRRLLVLGLLPLLLALGLCVKVGVMLGFDERGRSAFADGQFERAGEAFGVNDVLNLFEPWVSPFDEGTAEYRLADYATARSLLERALLVVPDERECLVRINLSLTLEALGDADLVDGRRDRAEAYWREGIAVLDEGSCRSTESDSSADPGAEAVAARSVATRLAEKLADRASDDENQDAQDPKDPPSLEELERRNEEAQEQRRKNEETREDEEPPDQTPPDEPADGDPTPPPTYSW